VCGRGVCGGAVGRPCGGLRAQCVGVRAEQEVDPLEGPGLARGDVEIDAKLARGGSEIYLVHWGAGRTVRLEVQWSRRVEEDCKPIIIVEGDRVLSSG